MSRHLSHVKASFGELHGVHGAMTRRATSAGPWSEDFDLLIIVSIFVNCISLALFRPTEVGLTLH